MSRAHLSAEELRARLRVPHFTDRATAPEAAEPMSKTPMVVAVADIEPYGDNPRTVPNRKYEDIKASLRANGLERPLAITRRPGATKKYTMYFGNNTLLAALQALCAESPALCGTLGRVEAVFYPWASDLRVLVNHLKENEDRDALTFIDRARAIRRARTVIESQLGRSLSQRRFVDELKRREGYVLSPSRMPCINYALDVLFPLIPLALNAGAGRPVVERIKRLHDVTKVVWAHHLPDEPLDLAFEALLRRHDDVSIDVDTLRRAIEIEIADGCTASRNVVTLDFESVWQGGTPASPLQTCGPDVAMVDPSAPATEMDPNHGRANLAVSLPTVVAGLDKCVATVEHVLPSDEVASGLDDALPGKTTTARVKPDALHSLRKRLWCHAAGLAASYDVADVIVRTPDQGCGYIVTDGLNASTDVDSDEGTLRTTRAVWWELIACSDMALAPFACLDAVLPQASVVRTALTEEAPNTLHAVVPPPDPATRANRLFARLEVKAWPHLAGLWTSYRKLHDAAGETGLWTPVAPR